MLQRILNQRCKGNSEHEDYEHIITWTINSL